MNFENAYDLCLLGETSLNRLLVDDEKWFFVHSMAAAQYSKTRSKQFYYVFNFVLLD
jgi:hypothetical protein